MKHVLFAADTLAPGELRAVSVEGVRVVVVRKYDGDYRALRDTCSHLGAPLSRGKLMNAVEGDEVGELRLSSRVELKCPWHGFQFDVDDGRCKGDPSHERVRVYPVTIEDGMVVLER